MFAHLKEQSLSGIRRLSATTATLMVFVPDPLYCITAIGGAGGGEFGGIIRGFRAIRSDKPLTVKVLIMVLVCDFWTFFNWFNFVLHMHCAPDPL